MFFWEPDPIHAGMNFPASSDSLGSAQTSLSVALNASAGVGERQTSRGVARPAAGYEINLALI